MTNDGTETLPMTILGLFKEVGVPLSVVLDGLSMLAPTGCDGIVNMSGFSQLGNIGSCFTLTIRNE
jgi:hypothetical protein